MGAVTSTLILLRHGESVWNSQNLFTGWVDVPLSERGVAEAARAGELMRAAAVNPDVLHTSLLRRAITTANLALDAMDRHWIPVVRSWRLNERHYGDLQGKDKKAVRDQYGEEQFAAWRRSYDVPPPPISDDNEYSQVGDPRYAADQVPGSECLADVVARLEPYLRGAIAADLAAGRTVLVAAHGNSIRAIVKILDGVSPDEIAGINIPTGIPLRYEVDADLVPRVPRGEYLDPEAAAAAITAVANQGK